MKIKYFSLFVCLFDLVLYVPVNNFSIMTGPVFLCCTSTEQGLMCLAQGHNTVTLVRFDRATPLRSLSLFSVNKFFFVNVILLDS